MPKMITVLTVNLPHELALPKGLLEEKGIPYTVENEHTVGMHHFYSQALGGIKLNVPAEQFEEVRQLFIDMGYLNALEPEAPWWSDADALWRKLRNLFNR